MCLFVVLLRFKTSFCNTSFISWRSVFLLQIISLEEWIKNRGGVVIMFNAIFNNSSVMAVRFLGGETPEKTTDLPQITDKLNHIMLYHRSTPRLRGIGTHNVSGDSH